MAPFCSICDKPATCFGSYEGTGNWGYACDNCCGHGNEDGCCAQLDDDSDDEPLANERAAYDSGRIAALTRHYPLQAYLRRKLEPSEASLAGRMTIAMLDAIDALAPGEDEDMRVMYAATAGLLSHTVCVTGIPRDAVHATIEECLNILEASAKREESKQ